MPHIPILFFSFLPVKTFSGVFFREQGMWVGVPYDAAMKQLASTLRAWRLHADLTQEQVGQHIGRGEASVSKYEKAKAVPPFEILSEMADLFGCTTEDLRHGRKPGEPKPEIVPSGTKSLRAQPPSPEPIIDRWPPWLQRVWKAESEWRGRITRQQVIALATAGLKGPLELEKATTEDCILTVVRVLKLMEIGSQL